MYFNKQCVYLTNVGMQTQIVSRINYWHSQSCIPAWCMLYIMVLFEGYQLRVIIKGVH